MPAYPRKLRAVAAAGVLTVALALPIGVAAAAESKEPTHGATLEAPVENSPLAPATEAKEAPEVPTEEVTPEEGAPKEGVTENAPLTPEAIRHPKLPPASGGTTAEEEPTVGEEELAEAGTEEEADEAARRAGEEAGTNLPAPVLQIPSLTASACRGPAAADPDLPARLGRLRPRTPGPRRPRRDQRRGDRLRHQPRPLLGRRGRLDAVHALHLGRIRGRRKR
jgi:hypothetical protein